MGLLKRLLSSRSNAAVNSPPSENFPPRGAGAATDRVVADAAALDAAGNHGPALALIGAGLQANPDDAALWLARGTSLYLAGRYLEARDACVRAERLGMRTAVLHRSLGWSFLWTGRAEYAEAHMRQAVDLDPGNWIGQFGLGTVLRGMGRHVEAIVPFERAIELQPDGVPALINLGASQLDLGNLNAAEVAMRKAVTADRCSSAAWTNLGVVLTRLEKLGEAIDAYRTAERLEREANGPAENFINFGTDLRESGDTPGALALYEERLPEFPTPTAQAQYALTLLGAGRFHEGWSHFESRWMKEPLKSMRSQSGRPIWFGQSLQNKTLLLRVEQGFGDNIQFLRFAPALKSMGGRVHLLVAKGFENIGRLFPGVDEVFSSGALVDYDYHLPVMSLGRVLDIDIRSMVVATPYLRAAHEYMNKWAPRLKDPAPLKVGLSWAGSPEHLRDRYRSLALLQLAPLFEVGGAKFYSLQKGPAEAELAASGYAVTNLGPELTDFCDTAAVIEQLDLVICVDTAIAHLAGALGKPTWLLLPQPADWRWLEGRDDSPWYPTMRLFRQRVRLDWTEVIGRVEAALREAVDDRQSLTRGVGVGDAPPLESLKLDPRQGAAPGIKPGFCGVAETRVGILQYRPHDDPVGRSLDWYGEYLHPQLELLAKIVRPGWTALEVGSGIGVHAVALAQMVGHEGHLLASEARQVLQRILGQNLPANGASNVTVLRRMVGRLRGGDAIEETVDGLQLERLNLLKVGEDADASTVLPGATDTIWRLRPVLFLAASDAEELEALARMAREFSYRCWKMETARFNPDNFNGRDDDIFAGQQSLALLAIPEEIEPDVSINGTTSIDFSLIPAD